MKLRDTEIVESLIVVCFSSCSGGLLQQEFETFEKELKLPVKIDEKD